MQQHATLEIFNLKQLSNLFHFACCCAELQSRIHAMLHCTDNWFCIALFFGICGKGHGRRKKSFGMVLEHVTFTLQTTRFLKENEGSEAQSLCPKRREQASTW